MAYRDLFVAALLLYLPSNAPLPREIGHAVKLSKTRPISESAGEIGAKPRVRMRGFDGQMRKGWPTVTLSQAAPIIGSSSVFKVKPHVILRGLDRKMRPVLAKAPAIWRKQGDNLVVTSGLDGRHRNNSLHYAGLALDLRSRNLAGKARIQVLNELREALGDEFQVLMESDHIHVEYHPQPRLAASKLARYSRSTFKSRDKAVLVNGGMAVFPLTFDLGHSPLFAYPAFLAFPKECLQPRHERLEPAVNNVGMAGLDAAGINPMPMRAGQDDVFYETVSLEADQTGNPCHVYGELGLPQAGLDSKPIPAKPLT